MVIAAFWHSNNWIFSLVSITFLQPSSEITTFRTPLNTQPEVLKFRFSEIQAVVNEAEMDEE